MSTMQSGGSWHVGRVGGRCAVCGAELAAQAACWAALCDGTGAKAVMQEGEKEGVTVGAAAGGAGGGMPFVRVDFCEKCWAEGKRPGDLAVGGGERLVMFSYWKTAVPAAETKKKLLVDDSVLVDVFGRMEGKHEPQEVRFRFVLALILMRKRLLKYEGTEEKKEGGEEVWRMVAKGVRAGLAEGEEKVVHVINPHLTADQIAEVSQQLSAILAEEV